MKKLILLLLVFIFIYPIFPKGFPVPLDRILQVAGFLLLLTQKNDLKQLINSKLARNIFLATGSLLVVAVLVQFQIKPNFDWYFVKLVLNFFLNCFSAYLLVWWARKCYHQLDFGIILQYLVGAALLQAFISFVFYANPSLFYQYLSLLNEKSNQGLLERADFINKRFIGVGSVFFSGVIKAGIAYFAILILPHFRKNKWTENRLLYFLCVLILGVSGLMIARTFMVAMILGAILYVFLELKTLREFFLRSLTMLLIVIGIYALAFCIIYLVADEQRFPIAFYYVFEIFINLFSDFRLETTSTDDLQSMYVFPDQLHTWLLGDARMANSDGTYFMHTDVGYLRLLFYFGLPATLLFVAILAYQSWSWIQFSAKQLFAFDTLKRKASRFFFAVFLLWFLILNLKGLVFESSYLALFLIALVFSFSAKGTTNNVNFEEK